VACNLETLAYSLDYRGSFLHSYETLAEKHTDNSIIGRLTCCLGVAEFILPDVKNKNR